MAAVVVGVAGGKDPAFTIKGVGLGTPLTQVRQVLGPPLSQLDERTEDSMGMREGKVIKYEGLILKLCKPEGKTSFHVWSIVVTDKRWAVAPGLRVGMERQAVIGMLGQPENSSWEAGSTRESLSYSFRSFDGYYSVALEKGHVVEISASEDWS